MQINLSSGTSITYRDELYRTARDVSLQATQQDNAREIDRYVMGLAARGDLETLSNMLLDGYDHVVDVTGTDGMTIVQVASTRGHMEVVRFLEGIRQFEVSWNRNVPYRQLILFIIILLRTGKSRKIVDCRSGKGSAEGEGNNPTTRWGKACTN